MECIICMHSIRILLISVSQCLGKYRRDAYYMYVPALNCVHDMYMCGIEFSVPTFSLSIHFSHSVAVSVQSVDSADVGSEEALKLHGLPCLQRRQLTVSQSVSVC